MKIAAIVTAHDVGPWVGQAIVSIARQTRPADQIIVVENGSTDDSLGVIERTCRDLGLGNNLSLVTDVALGPGGARNRGADIALDKGAELLAFLDGDDWWQPRHLELLGEALSAQPQAAAGFGWLLVRSPDGRLTSLRARYKRRFTYSDLGRHKSPMITASALVVRAKDFERIQGFDRSISVGEDWEMLLRLTSDGQSLLCRPRFLINYRRRPGSAVSDTRNTLDGLLVIEKKHPHTRLAKHWWWLLVKALDSGDRALLAEVEAARPLTRFDDFFSHHFLRYLTRRRKAAAPAQVQAARSRNRTTEDPRSK